MRWGGLQQERLRPVSWDAPARGSISCQHLSMVFPEIPRISGGPRGASQELFPICQRAFVLPAVRFSPFGLHPAMPIEMEPGVNDLELFQGTERTARLCRGTITLVRVTSATDTPSSRYFRAYNGRRQPQSPVCLPEIFLDLCTVEKSMCISRRSRLTEHSPGAVSLVLTELRSVAQRERQSAGSRRQDCFSSHF